MSRQFTLYSLFFWLISTVGWAQELEVDDEGFKSFTITEGDTTYVMREYVFVMLKAGPNRDQSPEEAAEIQKGHMEHMAKMTEAGYLAVAGPFGDDSEWRGIYIFNVNNIDTVRDLVNEDPAIQSGRLVAEIHPWWSARGTTLP
ncbi:YciI family protein [Phaeocystidibacter marisrubri]|uniref:YCII-related domain-containing protein n=1 Tax=Phaeocystidibacter marisrubri TaxID=1577780 RepID=A0A6L3ZHF7_9FLAO|nr:YciI family protein [Phaeocystidibacter marisrubri]KAB2816429.1 hypothetical protein F8C82_12165 [Phaeocystidibacter marisrubri]GGH69018.1 hypothetical protein GCM10011318_09610 [Phaeocystidibacter marisrubri]